MCIGLQIISKATLETSTCIYFIVREPFLGSFHLETLLKYELCLGRITYQVTFQWH